MDIGQLPDVEVYNRWLEYNDPEAPPATAEDIRPIDFRRHITVDIRTLQQPGQIFVLEFSKGKPDHSFLLQ
ncbi:hypothetical protein ACEPPN_017764 [Leptodophora sp. 'Broadleaf-Isolate-01']